jgi:hypothetical protein
MTVLEMGAPPRRANVVRGVATELCPAVLGLPSRPGFVPPSDHRLSEAGRSLWDRLRLSWTDPQLRQDLLVRQTRGDATSPAGAAGFGAGPGPINGHLRGTG